MKMIRWAPTVATIFVLVGVSSSAWPMRPSDGGVFVALTEEGEPVGKILRVTHTNDGWKFEDRQPDGSWLDVSCHGGCEHVVSGPDDLLRFFGELPPEDIEPDCIHNDEYAFCRLVRNVPGGEEDFVLIVNAGRYWQPISMARLAGPQDSHPDGKPEIEALESARHGGPDVNPC